MAGKVVSGFSQEPLPYATVYWKAGGFGCMTDSIGRFSLNSSHYTGDTLVVRYVGYLVARIPAPAPGQQADLLIQLETAVKDAVEVKGKMNRGLVWWRQIVARKPENAPGHYDSYHAQLYNKLEIDISNLNKTRWQHSGMLKPFRFVLQQVDSTSENQAFLPVFLSESISDYYVSSEPARVREEIRALHSGGIKNESVMEYLGGINQKINAYQDYMMVFGREFISPVSVAGDRYYHYRALDTVVRNGEQYFHLAFSPKREGENAFSGDCWIQASTWALQKITLSVNGAVNINFVKRLDIIQEYSPLNKKEWAVTKDRCVVELAPLGKEKATFIARKTTLYQQIKINEPYISERLNANRKKEEVVIADSATGAGAGYLAQHRPEALTVNERNAITLVDTLKSLPAFKSLSDKITFLFDGHIKLGKIEIGPWYKWLSRNRVEGLRMRFDLGTTPAFSRNLRLFGYLAYGTRDESLKGKLAMAWELPGNGGYSILASYKDDLDNQQRGFNGEEVSLDNIFGQLIRRRGIPQKFIREREMKFSLTKKLPMNFSLQGTLSRSCFTTYTPLPPHQIYNDRGQVINTELLLKARYAPGEREIRTFRKTRRMRSNLPVVEAAWSVATAGVLNSHYNYQKVSLSVAQKFRIPQWGQVSYLLYGGRIFSDRLPFMLLHIHPGNETYYYNKEAFSLMNKYEFISDRYAGLSIEHNFDGKLLNLLPFMRRTGIRQFWNLKAVTGDLSPENRSYNRFEFPAYGMRSFRGKVYTEVGTGLDNIFHFFRVDAVWRFYPNGAATSHPANFGLFGSFRLQF
ncbi:DUF5686 and carboxypeptidase-like regulatory domain-containing protein [Chitinophaga solisilvae]|uniref:DUF5686 and carboxypeptidase-like regulatory domain-containing protein n=1 Tax=Chitinophaga solisilvae TaxID=1233460 RepID=UPI00136865F1|nr:DUF5686 and carboxypeptidase-like regulatory domain-containing protein [Chitinophaga solisilvae]